MLESLKELFTHPIPNSIIGWVFFILFLISIFIDISKIKLNPWKHILKSISSVFNQEILTNQQHLVRKVDKIGKTFQAKHDKLVKQVEEIELNQLIGQKKAIRRRIIEFADECRRGVKHSQQMYLNVFKDITEYDKLCEKTGDPNHMVTESVAYIKEMYHDRLEKNDFI